MYSGAVSDGPTPAIMRNFGNSAPPPSQDPSAKSFRSALDRRPAEWGGDKVLEDDYARKPSPVPPVRAYLAVGLFTLGMLMLVPLWNALAMRADLAFTLFVGSAIPNAILGVCLGILVLYPVVVSCIFRAPPSGMQSEAAMAALFACFLTALAVALFALAAPLRGRVLVATTDVWSNCRFGSSTQALFDASESLQALRSLPECAGQASVENCAGYVGSPAATSLKAMESAYGCSGFCFEPPAANLPAEEAALGAAFNLPRCSSAPPPCVASPVPPTLFSRSDDEVSCSGIAARDLGTFGKEAADQLFYEAVMLAVVPAIMGFAHLLGQACFDGRGSGVYYPAFRPGGPRHYGAIISQPRGRFAGASCGVASGGDEI